MKVLPLFKTHYSLGRSILTLEKPENKKGDKPDSNSLFDILLDNKLDTLVLVEDNLSGLLQATQNAKDNKIKLIFGLRLVFTENCQNQNEDSLKKRAKYIIFAKNPQGYKDLLKVWSFAAREGFYYTPCLDFDVLKKLWTPNLNLVVPFYDSFLHLNTLHAHQHVPQLTFTKPIFLLEDNNLPFDIVLENKVTNYCGDKFDTLRAQSIYYKSSEDFLAYITFRCIHNRGSNHKSTLERPELNHMASDTFSFERWLDLEKKHV